MEKDVTACVIAGGRSRRMGRDKRLLCLDGATLMDRTLKILEPLFEKIIIVLASPLKGWNGEAHRVVYDAIQDCGSLGGLYTGLIESGASRIFAVACDMPFLNSDVIRYLVHIDRKADIVVAKLDNGFQPMHAVYSKHCAEPLEHMARSGNLRIQGLFENPVLKVKIITAPELINLDPDLRSFRNINTPADFEAAQALFMQRL
jgi:molybdopterin-guanine dinucleotide biosynthesis protein A